MTPQQQSHLQNKRVQPIIDKSHMSLHAPQDVSPSNSNHQSLGRRLQSTAFDNSDMYTQSSDSSVNQIKVSGSTNTAALSSYIPYNHLQRFKNLVAQEPQQTQQVLKNQQRSSNSISNNTKCQILTVPARPQSLPAHIQNTQYNIHNRNPSEQMGYQDPGSFIQSSQKDNNQAVTHSNYNAYTQMRQNYNQLQPMKDDSPSNPGQLSQIQMQQNMNSKNHSEERLLQNKQSQNHQIQRANSSTTNDQSTSNLNIQERGYVTQSYVSYPFTAKLGQNLDPQRQKMVQAYQTQPSCASQQLSAFAIAKSNITPQDSANPFYPQRSVTSRSSIDTSQIQNMQPSYPSNILFPNQDENVNNAFLQQQQKKQHRALIFEDQQNALQSKNIQNTMLKNQESKPQQSTSPNQSNDEPSYQLQPHHRIQGQIINQFQDTQNQPQYRPQIQAQIKQYQQGQNQTQIHPQAQSQTPQQQQIQTQSQSQLQTQSQQQLRAQQQRQLLSGPQYPRVNQNIINNGNSLPNFMQTNSQHLKTMFAGLERGKIPYTTLDIPSKKEVINTQSMVTSMHRFSNSQSNNTQPFPPYMHRTQSHILPEVRAEGPENSSTLDNNPLNSNLPGYGITHSNPNPFSNKIRNSQNLASSFANNHHYLMQNITRHPDRPQVKNDEMAFPDNETLRKKLSKLSAKKESKSEASGPIKQRKYKKKKQELKSEAESTAEEKVSFDRVSVQNKKSSLAEALNNLVKKKKRKINDIDKNSTKLLNETDEDDEYIPKTHYVKKTNTDKKLTATRQSRNGNMVRLEANAKKAASQANTTTSKRGAPKFYTDLYNSICLIDKFDWLDTSQHASKLLPSNYTTLQTLFTTYTHIR